MICELFIQYFIASGYIIKVAFCIPLTKKKKIYIYIYIYLNCPVYVTVLDHQLCAGLSGSNFID